MPIIAYHFLKADMTAGSGAETAWTVGEKRTLPANIQIECCLYGYHSSPSFYDALQYAPGPIACIVMVNKPRGSQLQVDKQVSRSRKLIKAVNIEKELWLFACDCAERALQAERESGREPDARSWTAIEVSRQYAYGNAVARELAWARDAAWDAARDAAWAATTARDAAWDAAWAAARAATTARAWAAARDAARAAAWDAARAATTARDVAWDAAWAAEIEWQRVKLAEYLNPLFADVLPEVAR